MAKGIVKIKYGIAFLLAVLLLTSFLFSMEVRAYETEDFSITGVYVVGDVQFSLYKLGQLDNGQFKPTDEYAGYNIDYHENEAAQTYEAYITRDKQEPLLQQKTDNSNDVVFSGLSKGVYLLTGNSSEQNGEIYYPLPAIAVLYDDENKNLPVVIKYKKESVQNKKDISVLKIWEDNNSKDRPDEISVQLLKDGDLYESVILNDDNSWRYQWKDLDGSAEWTVTEEIVPENYTVKISDDGSSFVVTNTASVNDEPPESSGGEGGSDPSKPESSVQTPETPVSSPTPSVILQNSQSDKSVMGAVLQKLPQTGQMNLPIVILLTAGLVFIIIGAVRRKKSDR